VRVHEVPPGRPKSWLSRSLVPSRNWRGWAGAATTTGRRNSTPASGSARRSRRPGRWRSSTLRPASRPRTRPGRLPRSYFQPREPTGFAAAACTEAADDVGGTVGDGGSL